MRITIAICTYNRCRMLYRALSTLTAQGSLTDVEIVVVDNNSSDETELIADRFRCRLPIKLIKERQQGLSHARNRALAEFGGDVIIFTDDDVLLDTEWLEAYRSAIRDFETAEYFGGRILPEWDGVQPRWIGSEKLDLIDGLLVWYDLGADSRLFCDSDPLPFGASFALRRSLAERVGSFRADLGCNGKVSRRGEETEYLIRAKRAGAQGAYVGASLCWHFVNQRRLSLRALYHYGVESGNAFASMSNNAQRGKISRVPIHLIRGLWQLFKGRGDRFRQCVINAGVEVGIAGRLRP